MAVLAIAEMVTKKRCFCDAYAILRHVIITASGRESEQSDEWAGMFR